MLDNHQPFDIRTRTELNGTALFIASRGGVDVATEKYRIGSSRIRRGVAVKWASDDRLTGGEPIEVEDVCRMLEIAELEANDAIEADELRQDEPGQDVGKGRSESQASKLLKLVERVGVELFHDADDTAWASIPLGGHTETYSVESRQFKRWLGGLFYRTEGAALGATGLTDSIGVLAAKGIHDGPEHEVHVRKAVYGGSVYLDLADEAWRIVRITAEGWSVVEDAPVKFTRSNGMRPLPVPVEGGSIAELREFINVGSDADFILVVSWLIGTMCPQGSYPILSVTGEQGSAKSFTCRILRRLIDPSKAGLRTLPGDTRDLMIAAANSHLLGFDNIRTIPPLVCDALCRVSTGIGFSTRELWTNRDELILEAARPILLNGIGETSEAPDLNDRRIVVSLPRIEETDRKTEGSIWSRFDEACPRILGALLDAVSVGLRNINTVKLDRLPRMADFALWVTACEPGLPWKPGEFMRSYDGCRADVHETNLEACPVGTVVREWLPTVGGGWTGKASKLLELLNMAVGDDVKRRRGWPKAANSLSNALRRIAPTLRAVGVPIDFDLRNATGTARLIAVGTDAAPIPIVQTDRIVQREEAENGVYGVENGDPDALYDLYDRTPILLAPGETAGDPFPEDEMVCL